MVARRNYMKLSSLSFISSGFLIVDYNIVTFGSFGNRILRRQQRYLSEFCGHSAWKPV